jgi:glycosyltransferase involved in cell wall biosynthesis
MIINKEKNFISAVLYVHNNEEQLQSFLKKLYHVLDDNFEKYEVILVNDCSTDDGVSIIKSFASHVKNGVFSVMNMSIYQGIELSMNAGVDLAIGDFVFEFDNLFIDYPIDLIMDIYFHSLKGYDIVSASPERIQRKSSRFFYKLFNSYSNNPHKLRTDSFRILSRRAINRVNSISKTIPYRKAVYANSGLKVDTIIYKQTENVVFKESKKVNEIRESVAIDSLILFTDIAYKISFYLTIVMVLISVFVGGYTVFLYLSQNKPVAGWTTTMLFLSIAFFGVFLVLAIVIKYLSILVDLVFKKQKYLIESIEKITK